VRGSSITARVIEIGQVIRSLSTPGRLILHFV
jgi:hypothetical protein